MELAVSDLTKAYPRGPVALDGINLTIGPGVFGLLGPNGAGKTTLMRIVATLQEPDSGSVRFGDVDVLRDPAALRRELGYLPQDFGLYPEMTAERMLDHLADLKGIAGVREREKAVRDLLVRTNLWHVRKRRLGAYSGGMRQRFGIAQALLGSPKLVIVDEPTTGLDPEERARFFNALSELAEGVVVILSTHIVDDVAQLCNRLAILEGGKIRFIGSPESALAGLEGRLWSALVAPADAPALTAGKPVVRTRRYLGKVEVKVRAAEWPGEPFEAATPDLEDVYFSALESPAQAIPEAA
jgi:ABC-2 type transport system ATP-binding protein